MGKIISLVSPKGGEGKSTLALTLSHSKPFKKLSCCILDGDSQGSLTVWHEERTEAKKKIRVDVIAEYNENNISEALDEYSQKFDALFFDCPGESEAGIKTRSALVKSNIALLPIKTGEFDMSSVIKHILPLIDEARDASERATKYFLLPSMIHVSSNKERVIERFEGTQAEVLNAVFPFRKAFSEFPEDGKTLEEYSKIGDKKSRAQARKAVSDIDTIAFELYWHLGLK